MYIDEYEDYPIIEVKDVDDVFTSLMEISGNQMYDYCNRIFNVFFEDRKFLKLWIEAYNNLLTENEQFFFLGLGGLIVLCFELPFFEYIDLDYESSINKYLSECDRNKLHLKAKLLESDEVTKKNLNDNIRVLLKTSKQPELLIYIAHIIFFTPISKYFSCKDKQLDILTNLHFIVNVLNDFYFQKSINKASS